MAVNSRFTIGIHILTLLAIFDEEPKTSDFIAASVNTNPVFIRRIMSELRKAGLVEAQPGVGGGTVLALPAEQITLLDVYRAVEKHELFNLHHAEPNPYCPCGGNIQVVLGDLFGKAETALETYLAGIKLSEVVRSVSQRAKLKQSI